MIEKFLPVGTVCQLNGVDQKVVITGFCMKNENQPDKIYDYVACYYPQGIYDQNRNLLFDHDQIAKVVYMGYQDEEEIAFKKRIKEVLANLEEPKKEYDPSIFDMDTPVASFVSEE